jgi:hypothetical protein
MLRRIVCGLGLAVALAVASACHTTTINPVAPTPPPTTETFTGLLNANGSNVASFTANGGGAVVATLTAVGPDSTQTIGFALGTFNTVSNACQVVFDNTAAVQSASFNTQASTVGTYCIRVYDNGSVATAVANGTATAFTYTVTVTHP